MQGIVFRNGSHIYIQDVVVRRQQFFLQLIIIISRESLTNISSRNVCQAFYHFVEISERGKSQDTENTTVNKYIVHQSYSLIYLNVKQPQKWFSNDELLYSYKYDGISEVKPLHMKEGNLRMVIVDNNDDSFDGFPNVVVIVP